MKVKGFHHIAIICSDYERSKKFYTEVLGFEIIKETYRKERDSWKLDLKVGEDDQIELFYFPNRPPRPTRPEALGLRHLAFEVENVEDTKRDLEQMGVVVEDIRTDEIDGMKFTFFVDPDGQPLEIKSY